jgi:hypothetical protein
MIPTFAHSDHIRSPYAATQAGNESSPIATPESAQRHSGFNGEASKKAKLALERDSFLTILLRALGAPHI